MYLKENKVKVNRVDNNVPGKKVKVTSVENNTPEEQGQDHLKVNNAASCAAVTFSLAESDKVMVLFYR